METKLLSIRLAAQIQGDHIKEHLEEGFKKEGYLRDLLFKAGMTSDQWEYARHASKWRVYYDGEDEAIVLAYDI